MATRGRPKSPALNDEAAAIFRRLMNEGMGQFRLTRLDLVRANNQKRKERRQMNQSLKQANPGLQADLAPVPKSRTDRWVYKCFESERRLLVRNAYHLYMMLGWCKIPDASTTFAETPFGKKWNERVLSLSSDETPWFLSETWVPPMAIIESRYYGALAKELAAVVMRELNFKSERIVKMKREWITEAIERYFKRLAPGWARLQWRWEKLSYEAMRSAPGSSGMSKAERKKHTIGGPFGDAWTRFRFGPPTSIPGRSA